LDTWVSRWLRMLRQAGVEVLAADIDEAALWPGPSPSSVLSRCLWMRFCALTWTCLRPARWVARCTPSSIAALRAGIVAGAANNQLRSDDDGARLADRGILYCPDFLINAGGIIDVHYQRSGLDRDALAAHIEMIGERLAQVLRAPISHSARPSLSPRSWPGN
jgi:leucine dehydrogenase